MNKLYVLALAALMPAGAIMADEAILAAAMTVVSPMMQEVAPGAAGIAFSECVLAQATPEELSMIAAAGGPNETVGALVSAILARPETIACATEKLS